MTAYVYRWHGTPEAGHAMRIGTVWVGADGRAEADIALEPDILDPRSGRRIPVTDGTAYVDALPFHFRNPPYIWAEAAIPPRPDISPHRFPITALGLRAEA